MPTAKSGDGVQRYASVSREITGIEDMRSLVEAYDAMKTANPDLTEEGWDFVDTHEYAVTVANY